MAEITDAEIEAANRRGEIMMRTYPRAIAVRYDAAKDRLVIELASGAIFSLPLALLQGFEDASVEARSTVEISATGLGLHWPMLDADFTVPGLLAGHFGTRRYMTERFGADWDAVAAA